VKKILFYHWFLLIICFPAGVIIAQDVVAPPAPDTLSVPRVVVNTQPLSEIDIPVSMSLKPIYGWANKFVDTLYTSPNYPNDWVQEECEIRYQYRFVRGPFAFRAMQNTLLAKFTGNYGVRGATRICSSIGNSVWSPSCTCGFGTEKPRRIDAGFAAQFKLMPDYKLAVTAKLTNPNALDKCEVCFFGKDITKMVAAQLKAEMEASIAEMQRQLQSFSLRNYLQTVWDTLQTPYSIPGFGYLNMQPEALRISQATLRNDSMFFSLGLSARPELKQTAAVIKKPLPNITDFSQRGGFSLYIAQMLPYDSLNALANEQAGGKEFSVGKGVFKKTVRIDSMRLLGGGEKVYIQVFLARAIKGVVYLEGQPVWDPVARVLEIKEIDYEIKSKQVLVRSAAWLMDGTIEKKLKEYTRFDLGAKADTLRNELQVQMNRELVKGITSRGIIEQLTVEKLLAQPDGIFIGGSLKGKLWLTIDAGAMIAAYMK
jgi:hypothetical protein